MEPTDRLRHQPASFNAPHRRPSPWDTDVGDVVFVVVVVVVEKIDGHGMEPGRPTVCGLWHTPTRLI